MGASTSCIQVALKPSGPVGRVALEDRVRLGTVVVIVRHNSAKFSDSSVQRRKVLIYNVSSVPSRFP